MKKVQYTSSIIFCVFIMITVFTISCGGGGGGGSASSTTNSSKAITTFAIAGVAGSINETNKTITITMPYGTNVTALVATFTTTGSAVKVGATPQISGTSANDFTNSVNYTVTAADSTTVNYTVSVTVAAVSAKAITAFSFISPAATGVIIESTKTISITVPSGTNVTALVATFTTTGVSVKVGSTTQVSGSTPNNFTNPVSYTVTATDGSVVTYTVTVIAATTSALIIDHTSVAAFNRIPADAIVRAKATLKIAYGHTSHGSQLITGMDMLSPFHTWRNGALDLRDYYGDFGGLGIANDLGNPNYTAWASATRTYLNQHPEVNVIIWSWCWQMNTTEANINTYLTLMHQLEHDFPNVKFVYMTGHVDAGQEWGEGNDWSHNHYMRAKQIRDFVKANNGILYDFADIESYDPSGNWYGDKLVTDNCDYDSNGDGVVDSNWAISWCSANSCVPCNGCAHSQCLNCYMKGKAVWSLWARLAGWNGN
jgi:hypothetical protein